MASRVQEGGGGMGSSGASRSVTVVPARTAAQRRAFNKSRELDIAADAAKARAQAIKDAAWKKATGSMPATTSERPIRIKSDRPKIGRQ